MRNARGTTAAPARRCGVFSRASTSRWNVLFGNERFLGAKTHRCVLHHGPNAARSARCSTVEYAAPLCWLVVRLPVLNDFIRPACRLPPGLAIQLPVVPLLSCPALPCQAHVTVIAEAWKTCHPPGRAQNCIRRYQCASGSRRHRHGSQSGGAAGWPRLQHVWRQHFLAPPQARASKNKWEADGDLEAHGVNIGVMN